MDEISTTGTEDEVIARHMLCAIERYRDHTGKPSERFLDALEILVPVLVREKRALLSAIGAKSVKEALEKLASAPPPEDYWTSGNAEERQAK
jgi:hypothetical protein